MSNVKCRTLQGARQQHGRCMVALSLASKMAAATVAMTTQTLFAFLSVGALIQIFVCSHKYLAWSFSACSPLVSSDGILLLQLQDEN